MDISIFSADREMPLLDELRSTDPVHWNPPSALGPGFWALTRYEDVKAAAYDNTRLSSASGTQIVDRKVEGKLASLHNLDDPEHAKLRKIAVPHLRSVKIKQWQEMIDEAVTYLLDDVTSRDDEFDMVHTVSARLPMLVLSRVLGVPAQDAPKMVDWTNRLTSSDPADQVDATSLAEARDEVMSYFEMLTELRRREPGHDLISVLANGEKDGRPLTWDELAAYYIVLVAAGNETTRHAVSGGTILFDRNRSAWERLVADRSALNPAVEEVLRWVSPVAAMRRTALEPMTIGGKDITAGDKVVLWFSAANRDPEVFDDPHAFRIDRTPNEHLTFGWGVHFCLGAHLARAEIRAFFTEALRRNIHFEVTGSPVRVEHNIFRGWTDLPVCIGKA
ncbi:putative cytochrome P450 [Gordonia polyisoprenivorans NBRC 16320 = JCM 10675]|uniref:Cytochrome P450 n=2 Tax=Gordonia polyisoprenivorans TaxID=84595 RepID=A0A846WU50_9ACTN|nr:cytochrome P450 [Gordonia polyisoprenivorans]GAB25491.1 putative cytochrome P450 [Gordonia polyisoprenivorans NBRC 16320 = JCM 10675]